LRANGSRECAPDDKLREAIQQLLKMDCFVAHAPRNDAAKVQRNFPRASTFSVPMISSPRTITTSSIMLTTTQT